MDNPTIEFGTTETVHQWCTFRELIFAGTNFLGRKKNRKNPFSRFSLFRIFCGNYFSRLDQILK